MHDTHHENVYNDNVSSHEPHDTAENALSTVNTPVGSLFVLGAEHILPKKISL